MNTFVSLHGFLFIVLNSLILVGLLVLFAMALFVMHDLGERLEYYIKRIRNGIGHD